MCVKYAKLRGKIKEVFNTQAAFAAAMEMTNTALSYRLNGHCKWQLIEVEKACDLLEIPADEMAVYFFN